jgi:PAS domain S-box-containing protein
VADPGHGRIGPTFVSSTRLHGLIAVVTLGAFAADAALEQEVASGVLYVAMVALSAWMPGMRSTLGMGVAATALTILGHFIAPPGGALATAVVNRLLAVFAICVTAALVVHHKRLTARHQEAEARAARSERQFRATVESNPSGMLLVDGNGRIALANIEAERLFGYPRHELLGRPVETLVPELDRQAHADHRAAFMAEPESRRMASGREINGVDKQGRAVLVEIGLARVETLDGDYVLVTVADMADRKLLEQARGAQMLARRLVEAEEAQRKRMAREIHDALGQALTALKLDIGWLAGHLPAGQAGLHARAMQMEELAARTIEDVRRLSAELRPAILDDQGLLAAMRWQVGDFEKRSGLRCALALPDAEINWDKEQCTVVYRVLQEALTNVARHAMAHKVSVALWREQQGDAVLEVRDDGRGISEQEAGQPDGLGLLGMRERALLHGGTLTVTGIRGGGTTVLLRLPCPPAEALQNGRQLPERDADMPLAAEERA